MDYKSKKLRVGKYIESEANWFVSYELKGQWHDINPFVFLQFRKLFSVCEVFSKPVSEIYTYVNRKTRFPSKLPSWRIVIMETQGVF